MDTVFEHEGSIFIDMEVCIDILLKRVEAMGMEIEVLGDDMSDTEYQTTRTLAKGLSFAALVLTNEYILLTPREDRKAFYSALADRMYKIVEAS